VTDWSDLERAAASLRRLNRALAGFEVPAGDLAELTATADGLAQRLERGTPRSKADDMVRANGGQPPSELPPPAIGEAVSFDQFSAAGGRFHPCSVGLAFVRDGECSVRATTTVDPMFQGPPGRVHGGVVAMLVDEVMGVVNRVSGTMAFTGQLSLSYRAAAPVGEELVFRAWREAVDGRKVSLRAVGAGAEGVFVEADGLFITVPATFAADEAAPRTT
jgi:acyl-coenzyme A thioesterase PaaI-like protein